MHYKRWLSHGDPTHIAYSRREEGEQCSVDECERLVWARRMCTGHYQRWLTGKPVDGPLRARNTPTDTHKTCPSCGEFKELGEYSTQGGRQASWCKVCRRYGNKKRQYGLSRDDYTALISSGCAICKKADVPLVVDHDHGTGRVRGALCSNCNIALGHAFDNPKTLRAMAAYLENGATAA